LPLFIYFAIKYGPPLILRWGTCFALKSTSGAVNSILPKKCVYLSAKRGLVARDKLNAHTCKSNIFY